jgi:hypothetical protein
MQQRKIAVRVLDMWWMDYYTPETNGQAQWEEVQHTKTITLSKGITELLPFVTFPCPEYNL